MRTSPPAPKYFPEIVPSSQIFPLNCAPVANISQKLCPHRIISHGIRTELCPWTTKPPLPPKKLATGLMYQNSVTFPEIPQNPMGFLFPTERPKIPLHGKNPTMWQPWVVFTAPYKTNLTKLFVGGKRKLF